MISSLRYRIWNEWDLWHWVVDTERGKQAVHGACNDRVKARTEALAYAIKNRSVIIAEQIWQDVERIREVKACDICRAELGKRATNSLIEKAREAVRQSRGLLKVLDA
jgi:hypothetical protein